MGENEKGDEAKLSKKQETEKKQRMRKKNTSNREESSREREKCGAVAVRNWRFSGR
jgi:hypothetical protein